MPHIFESYCSLFIGFVLLYDLLCVRVTQFCVGAQGKNGVYKCILSLVNDRGFFVNMLNTHFSVDAASVNLIRAFYRTFLLFAGHYIICSTTYNQFRFFRLHLEMTLKVLSLSQSLCLTYNRWVLDFFGFR